MCDHSPACAQELRTQVAALQEEVGVLRQQPAVMQVEEVGASGPSLEGDSQHSLSEDAGPEADGWVDSQSESESGSDTDSE